MFQNTIWKEMIETRNWRFERDEVGRRKMAAMDPPRRQKKTSSDTDIIFKFELLGTFPRFKTSESRHVDARAKGNR